MSELRQGWRAVVNEETLLPISMVFAVASFAAWISTVANETKTNAAAISDIHEQYEYLRDQRQRGDTLLAERMREQDKVLREIAERLGRIEGKLDAGR